MNGDAAKIYEAVNDLRKEILDRNLVSDNRIYSLTVALAEHSKSNGHPGVVDKVTELEKAYERLAKDAGGLRTFILRVVAVVIGLTVGIEAAFRFTGR